MVILYWYVFTYNLFVYFLIIAQDASFALLRLHGLVHAYSTKPLISLGIFY